MYTCTCKKSRQYGLSLIHSGLSARSATPPAEGGRIGRALHRHHQGLASSWPCSLSNSLGLSHSPPFLPPPSQKSVWVLAGVREQKALSGTGWVLVLQGSSSTKKSCISKTQDLFLPVGVLPAAPALGKALLPRLPGNCALPGHSRSL